MLLLEAENRLLKNDTLIFIKQPFYNQLALGGQIAKKVSGLNTLSLSSNKNYRLKKSEVFFSVIIPDKPTIHQNSAVSKVLR